MSKAMKFAAAIAVALPMLGIAGGAAHAQDWRGDRYEDSRRYDDNRYEERRDRGRDDRREDRRVWSERRIYDYVSTYYYDVNVQRRDGDRYIVMAETPRGVAVRLYVNAYTGHIADSRQIRGGSGQQRPPLFGPGRSYR